MSFDKLAELGHYAAMARMWRRRMRRKDCSSYTVQMFVYYQEKMDAQIDSCREEITAWTNSATTTKAIGPTTDQSPVNAGIEAVPPMPEEGRENVEDGLIAKTADTFSNQNTRTNSAPKNRQKKENKP